ncbi:GntR family transcriptional regulator/MocR family aminotransferase [Ruminiclostridium sufflavum DSM 19573]|uniref:GntR family transcriptional regulator/MocR family aminotransferase n=1 Tax=Ruminiclostridium sufflavum DSM 19573 TaxID=1121337 RepID=A0A318XJL2_9FIRM|nr:PLP-dependent aminotransferase family protein [Ruminiclostridium sufflavum]PYG86648.1 GntR family transcriptional regulator/MocR family aminotransferase [Ruminiclostridium sufflavum DSM 19573]
MIYVDKNTDIPLYEQVYLQIKRGIAAGGISKGKRLPGIRTLSKTLGVARNTVDRAYTQLAVEGYITPRKGCGFVVEGETDSLLKKIECPAPSASGSHVCRIQKDCRKIEYDFQYGNFPNSCFPIIAWKRHTAAVLGTATSAGITQYGSQQGNISLRKELQAYLHHSRGVFCSEEQIVIGCGLQYSLDILCKLFEGHKKIAMEEPGYSGARELFKNNGFSLHGIAAKKDGLDLTSLKGAEVCAAYITPSHQFPYGSVLSIYKRKKLLKWAVESNSYIIEDDYDSEYRYDANPVPSLQSLDSNDRVIYIGTFSKALSPALRVNYMVLPKHLLEDYHRRFSSYSSPVSWLIQEVLSRYMASGEYVQNVRKMCSAYRKRHDVFVQECAEQFGKNAVLHGRGAGLHFLLELPEGTDTERLIRKAEKAGVRVYPVRPFWNRSDDCPDNLIFMGYSLLDEKKIREGIRLLRYACGEDIVQENIKRRQSL